jgi:hypothetical protein
VRSFQPAFLQTIINSEKLSQLLERWVLRRSATEDCDCIPWFTQQRSTGSFEIPSNEESSYGHHLDALLVADDLFAFRNRETESTGLTDAEKQVLRLYIVLLRPFNNLPTPLSAEWFLFGFCFCANRAQKCALSIAYIELAKRRVPHAEIARVWEEKSLPRLMEHHGIDISKIQNWGISMHTPPIAELGIYRLVAEVTHALSGFYCNWCFRPSCNLHSTHEHILHYESESDYGFTGTNAWERWQLLSFYKYIFTSPGFDAREMQNAKRDDDPGALERYLEGIVPDFRRKIFDRHLADAGFPKLRSRISFGGGVPECDCLEHSPCLPDGLNA